MPPQSGGRTCRPGRGLAAGGATEWARKNYLGRGEAGVPQQGAADSFPGPGAGARTKACPSSQDVFTARRGGGCTTTAAGRAGVSM